MVKFKDFSRPLSVFQVFFKANLIFKDFSRQSFISSTFQACVNAVIYYTFQNENNMGTDQTV